jgi:hypothetical protein
MTAALVEGIIGLGVSAGAGVAMYHLVARFQLDVARFQVDVVDALRDELERCKRDLANCRGAKKGPP